MRASAYYCKAVFSLLATASMGVIWGCACVGGFLDRMEYTTMLENLGLLLRSILIPWGLIVIPFFVSYHIQIFQKSVHGFLRVGKRHAG